MGLGDFFNGLADSTVHITESAAGATKNAVKAVGWAAQPSHWDDIGRGAVKGAEFVGHHVEDVVKAGGFLATHPQYWGDAAKKMIVDQFTNPVNIVTNVAMLGLTVATGGAAGAGFIGEAAGAVEGVATAAKAAEVGEGVATGVRAARTAEGAAEAAKAAETASAVSRGGEAAGTASRLREGAQGFQGRLDAFQQLPTKIHQGVRESLGLNPLTLTQRARQGLAEGFLERTGGIESQGSGMFEHARQFVGQRIANAPGAPSLVGGGDAGKFAEVNYRANRVASQVSTVKDLRTNLQNKAMMVEAVADPKKAAVGLAKQHKGDIIQFAAHHAEDAAVSSVKNSLFGNKETKAPSTMPQVEAPAAPAPTNWERSDTGMVASQPRSVSSGAVTTTSSVSNGAVGPSKWYGQSGYSTGRGFQSPSSQQQWGTTPWTQDPAYS